MRQVPGFLLCLILLSSCKGQNSFIDDRLKTTDEFIECLKNNTPDKILDYTFPNGDEKINNKRSRDFYVNKAYNYIKKFGLPPKDKWIVEYKQRNFLERLLITIPLFKGDDTTYHLLKADLIIAFPPPQISDKICRYDIACEYEMRPLLAPTPKDTIKH